MHFEFQLLVQEIENESDDEYQYYGCSKLDIRAATTSSPHKNGLVTLAPFLLHERGPHSCLCPVVKRISNESVMAFLKSQNMFHKLNHLGFIKNIFIILKIL